MAKVNANSLLDMLGKTVTVTHQDKSTGFPDVTGRVIGVLVGLAEAGVSDSLLIDHADSQDYFDLDQCSVVSTQ